MLETIINAFKIKEVRQKIFMTILFIIIYRLGCYLPVPGFVGISSSTGATDFVSLLNAITGSSLSQGTLFAIGITPYINASIIVQLLTVAIPSLEAMSKEGEEGRKKIDKITRWVTLGLAIISALGVVLGLGGDKALDATFLGGLATEFLSNNLWILYIYVITVLVGGSMLCMWLGERITEYGVSNGISIIIFVGIISSFGLAMFNTITGATEYAWLIIMAFVVTLILIFAFIVWVDGAERKIKVQYAKQVKGNKMYGGQATVIPIKVNASGVMPLIFAYALLSFPTMIISTFAYGSDFYAWWATYMGTGSVVYTIVLAVLIFAFSYFYSEIQFNPIDISKNIQNNGGFIPGIRPGRETADYLSKVVSRITLWGAIFLAIIALVPSVLFSIPSWFNLPVDTTLINSFSATGMLIVVSVALEFHKALENQILMRHYKGFLK